MLEHLPGMQETWVRPLGWEDPLEKEVATHSSTLAWRIPWREEPGGLQSMGLQRVGHDFTSLHFIVLLICCWVQLSYILLFFFFYICRHKCYISVVSL